MLGLFQRTPPPRRLSRRSTLRLWAAALGTSLLRLGPTQAQLASAAPRIAGSTAADSLDLTIASESAELRFEFDPDNGRFGLTSLRAHETPWSTHRATAAPALWIEGVQSDDGPPRTIDGSNGLELVASSEQAVSLVDSVSGLRLDLAWETNPGNAITHRLSLVNGREDGPIQVAAAATLSLPLLMGDWIEALGADGTPIEWETVRQDLPASFGSHELRNAEHGVYPLVRLAASNGTGILIAVSTATAWRVHVGLEAAFRLVRAGEYRSDLTLQPGESARLPDVVTIFHSGGRNGTIADLRRYLERVSLPPPAGWTAPPVVFNTWFAYGNGLLDDGKPGSDLRRAARMAAEAGVEVFVVDAGWYLGSPLPDGGGTGADPAPAGDSGGGDSTQPPRRAPGVFEKGLGTWVENPSKWLAPAGAAGSPNSGLRNFADYIHSLEVQRSGGSSAGRMRFGLWVEPERLDPAFERPERLPMSWTLPGAPILDFSRPEVVDGLTRWLQRAIDAYQVDYLKVDANLGVGAEEALGRSGHFWTRWSAGFEQLLANLSQANPSLYLEHCASGLKRFWIGLPGLAHSTWLDDDVEFENVERVLRATDFLMLPRQKTVLVTEDFSRYRHDDRGGQDAREGQAELEKIVQAYWGGDRRNGGTIGFSSRVERWGPVSARAAREAIVRWKREVRGSG